VRPYLEKNLRRKGAGRVAQGVGPKFKCQYHKNKKESLEIGFNLSRYPQISNSLA
jgi:hypothetical protein